MILMVCKGICMHHRAQKPPSAWTLCSRTEALSGMRNFSELGGHMVSVLRIQGQNKTTWTKIQGGTKDHGSEYKDLNFCE